METVFKLGDSVFDIAYGWGTVTDVFGGGAKDKYPIFVEFESEDEWYTLEGERDNGDDLITVLSFTEYSMEFPGFSKERKENIVEKKKYDKVETSTTGNCLLTYIGLSKKGKLKIKTTKCGVEWVENGEQRFLDFESGVYIDSRFVIKSVYGDFHNEIDRKIVEYDPITLRSKTA